jgi:hypothetical protein
MAIGQYVNTDTVKAPSKQSIGFKYGTKFKFKICNYYAIGLDINYDYTSYRIRQDSTKILPDSNLHFRERISFQSINAALFNRFNFKKRGDRLGTYLDLGAYYGWLYRGNHFTKDKNQYNSPGYSKYTIVRNKKVSYVNNYNYGFFARLGGEYLSLNVSYRFSDLFVKNYIVNYPELPRLFFGLEIRLAQ